VDLLSPHFPIAFDGTDDLPSLPPTPLDEFARGNPRVKGDVNLIARRQEGRQAA